MVVAKTVAGGCKKLRRFQQKEHCRPPSKLCHLQELFSKNMSSLAVANEVTGGSKTKRQLQETKINNELQQKSLLVVASLDRHRM